MPNSSIHTTQLHDWLKRMRAGDLSARDELLHAVGNRLEALTRKMYKDFSSLRRWVDTDDVLQESLLRLLRALEEVQPASIREFYSLAAWQIRRELLDLARHHALERACSQNAVHEPADHAADADELERWCRFHQEVAGLPVEEREVVGLLFYHGCSQAEAAEVFDVTVRTIQRRWQSALLMLHAKLRDETPDV